MASSPSEPHATGSAPATSRRGATSSPPSIAFVIEQALGHVAYGMSLQKELSHRADLAAQWIPVPFAPETIRGLPKLSRNWTVRGSVRAWQRIRRAEQSASFSAMFLHTQTIGLLCARQMQRIPTLLSLDATPRNYDELASAYGHEVSHGAFERLKLEAHRHIVRQAGWLTTWSQWAKNSLVRDYGADPARVTVIHPGTPFSIFPAADERKLRQGRPFRMLFVGGDFVRKGGDLLLDVFRQSFQDTCELHLVTGAELPPSKNVFVYRGLKPHSPELLRLYRESDAFVLPTRGDCLAVVLGEAMASALPIVTTAVGAHGEAVEEGESGYVIPLDSADALRDRLQQLVAHPDLAHRMGQRSRRVGEERFDMKKNADRIADILLDLSARPRRVPS